MNDKSKEGFIIQILGKFAYKIANFQINDFEYRSTLASSAIYRFLNANEREGRNWKILLLVPESLILTFIKSREDLEYAELSKEEMINLFLSKIKESKAIDEDIIEKGGLELVLIPSIGKYSPREAAELSVIYENSFGNIVITTFLEILKRIKANDIRIIFSITTGFNVYVSTTIEALRYIIVYWKLKNILSKDKGKIRVQLASHEPLIGISESDKIKIELIDYDVRAFFSYPLTRDKSLLSFILEDPRLLKSELGNRIGKLSNEMSRIIRSVSMYLAFNAIRYNTPLAFLHNEDVLRFDENKEDDIKNALHDLERLIDVLISRKIEKENNKIITSYRPLDHKKILSIYLTQALSISIFRFWKEEFKPLIIHDFDGNWVNVEELLELFKDVYERLDLNLNSRFLERDIRNILALKDCLKPDEGPKTLKELIKRNYEKERNSYHDNKEKDTAFIHSDIKRNFFAHSGFLNEITYVKKKEDMIFIRWKQAKNITFNTIKEWLASEK